jgi:phosphatidylglycerol:prolipoprotein diacylglycerol transferase
MNPVAFSIGPFTVYWYGILVVAGVLGGTYASIIQARRRGQDPEHVWNALLICLILGILGARIYHVFSTSRGGAIGWPYYRQHPEDIFKIWKGGLGLIGAIAGGALGMVLYARFAHLPVLTWLDIGAYGLLLAQAIGRWGNYINQELYGPPTSLPWGIPIAAPFRIAPFNDLANYPLSTRFHPVFLYESLWCLAGFVLLWWLSARYQDRLLPGDPFLLYLAWYPVGRFLVEFLRPDAWMLDLGKLGSIAVAQIFSALTAMVAIFLLGTRRRPGPAQAGTAAALAEDMPPGESARHPQADTQPADEEMASAE